MKTSKDLLKGINRWVSIESKSDNLSGIAAMMDLAEQEFNDAGLVTNRIPGTDGFGDHFSARLKTDNGSAGILVLCHLDTVHPQGVLQDNPVRTEGDRAYGPGIYDMKGGVYLGMSAAAAMIEEGFNAPLPVRFLVVSDEEVGSPTSRVHIEAAAKNAKYVLVVEPARDGGKIVTARKGAARAVLTAKGRPAHSGIRHQDGESAILEVARHIPDIEAMTDYDSGLTVNVGLINGGTGANVVPEHCSVEIDIRMTALEDGERALSHLRGLEPFNKKVSLDIAGQVNRPPFQKSDAIAKLFAHAHTLAAEIGFELIDTFTGGGSDGNFTAASVATLDGLGVDGHGAHTLEEHLFVSSLQPRMALLKRLFETLD